MFLLDTPVAVFEPLKQVSGTTNLPDGAIHIHRESSYNPHGVQSVGPASSSKVAVSSSPTSYSTSSVSAGENINYGEHPETMVAVLAVPSWMSGFLEQNISGYLSHQELSTRAVRSAVAPSSSSTSSSTTS